MTDDKLGSRSRGDSQRQEPLTLKLGGLKGAIPMVISAAVVGLFAVAMIAAIVNGKLLWLTIPLAVVFTVATLVVLTSVRRSAIPYGLIIDDQGIHPTLRGRRTASFTWDNVAAAGLSYIMVRSGELGTKRPGQDKLDVFCSTPQLEVSTKMPEVGHPRRIDDGEQPPYGAAEGHIRIDIGAPYPSKRENVKEAISTFGGNRLIENFKRPEQQYRQRDTRRY